MAQPRPSPSCPRRCHPRSSPSASACSASCRRLPRIIGRGAMRELAFTGKDIDAARALAIGLVEHVAPDRGALDDLAKTLAAEIAAAPPLVVRGVKHVLDQCEGKSVADGLDYV